MNVIEHFIVSQRQMSAIRFTTLEKYDVGKMMADNMVLYDQFGVGSFPGLKMFLPFIYSETKLIRHGDKGNGLIIMSSTYADRKDFRKVENTLQEIRKDLRIIEEVKIKKEFNKYIFSDLRDVIGWYKALTNCGLNPKCACFLIKRMQVCRKIVRQLTNEHLLDDVKYIISQYDAHDVDNIICQEANRLGIPTITLQHGHFHRTHFIKEGVYRIGAPFEGFVSDYFFAWGNYTKNEAVNNGLDPERIIVTGSLKNNGVKAAEGDPKLFAVILNGRYAQDDNKRLLLVAEEVAYENNYHYIIRPHPTDKHNYIGSNLGFLNRVSNQDESIYELASKVGFVICGNSTVVSEMINMEKAVFILNPKDSVDYYEQFKALRFSDTNELKLLISIYNSDPSRIIEQIKTYKNELFGTDNAEESYNNSIDWILGK